MAAAPATPAVVVVTPSVARARLIMALTTRLRVVRLVVLNHVCGRRKGSEGEEGVVGIRRGRQVSDEENMFRKLSAAVKISVHLDLIHCLEARHALTWGHKYGSACVDVG